MHQSRGRRWGERAGGLRGLDRAGWWASKRPNGTLLVGAPVTGSTAPRDGSGAALKMESNMSHVIYLDMGLGRA